LFPSKAVHQIIKFPIAMVLTPLTADGPLTADAFGIDNHMAWNSGAPNGKPHSHAHDAKNEADDFAMERGETDVDNSSGSRPVRRTRSSPTRSSSPNMDRDDLAGLSAKHHAKDFFTCCLKVDFAENIDSISTVVFPAAYVIMTKTTFPQVGFTEFILYFPILFASTLMFVQMVMEANTLYEWAIMRNWVPTQGGPKTYKSKATKAVVTIERPGEETTQNPASVE
jgi:hypothetical protein